MEKEELIQKIKDHKFNFFTAKKHLMVGNTQISVEKYERVCIDAQELWDYLETL